MIELPEKPTQILAAGQPVTCTFCWDNFAPSDIAAVYGYTACCHACFDAGCIEDGTS